MFPIVFLLFLSVTTLLIFVTTYHVRDDLINIFQLAHIDACDTIHMLKTNNSNLKRLLYVKIFLFDNDVATTAAKQAKIKSSHRDDLRYKLNSTFEPVQCNVYRSLYNLSIFWKCKSFQDGVVWLTKTVSITSLRLIVHDLCYIQSFLDSNFGY